MNRYNIKQTILIVDDMPENISILCELLKNEYALKIAIDGEKALQVAQSDCPPDLILLDVVMPGISGYEVCKMLKSDQATKNIPVIFITSRASDLEEVKGFEVGAVDYITKPFSAPVIRARIKTHTELKRYKDFLENFSYNDGLTGLPNRRKFDEHYNSAWHFAMRNGQELSLILIDIDFFKQYNDHYGHLAGDDCLKLVAEHLAKTIKRKTDFICRYGGEEFLCILPDTSMDMAEILAERLRETVLELEIPHNYSQVSPFVSVSLGVATAVPNHKWQPEVLFDMADKALYQSKGEGRNKVNSRCLTSDSCS